MTAPTHPQDYLRQFERLLAELSARFVNLPAGEVDAAIRDALRDIVLLLDVDRCQLIRYAAGTVAAEVTHSWAVDGVPAVPPQSVAERFPWAFANARAGRIVAFRSLDELPPAAAIDKSSWQAVELRSHLTMPMKVGGRVVGSLAFGCLRRERDWPADLIERVGILATVLANALAHKRAREALDAAIAFEQTVSGVLGALGTASTAAQDGVIEAGLGDMARVLGAEHATLWQRVADKSEFIKTHRWLAGNVPVPPDPIGAIVTSWIRTELAAGRLVQFANHADLPPEAGADRAELLALHIRAAVMVPLKIGGQVVGALSFASTREVPAWPEELLPRVRLVGDVFAATLARQAAERRERAAQAQAAHAARVGTMGVLAASLVHELTQPLAAGLANAETAAELLAARVPDLGELRATVADIVADDRRAGDLIQQLRRFLRRGEMERTSLDLREVIQEVLRLARNGAPDRFVPVAVDVPDELPLVFADRVQIQQVVLNLLLNAFDAVAASEPAAGSVALHARASALGIRIEVRDRGPGMDEATCLRIFEPFFTTKPHGMGLGLSISGTIVASHGGTLSVQSAPGQGTTFALELPLRPTVEGMAAPLQSADSAEARGMVFVIDDDPSMRRALDRLLSGAGYRVETFASAQEFLARPRDDGIACIVTDLRMPEINGLDLQATLAQDRRGLPLVFISGHGDVPAMVHAMKSGAVSFLAKPFSRDELIGAVAEALTQSRDTQEERGQRDALHQRYASLTPREREVFVLVAEGMLNKVIADRLNAAEATIKIHRGRVMEKMAADSVADLVRMAERLALRFEQASPPA